ncbi:MAG: hypothetical protein WB784_08115 [Rhodanobacteraceae bacterium]
MFRQVILAIVAALVFSSPLAAKDPVEKAVVADTAAKFTPLADSIRHQMEPGGRYEFIGSSDKRLVDTKLNEMESLLKASGSVAGMPEADRIKLFNAQEQVNGILADNASDRLICQKVAPTGSHLPITICKTYGELARNRAESRKEFDTISDQSRAARAAELTGH